MVKILDYQHVHKTTFPLLKFGRRTDLTKMKNKTQPHTETQGQKDTKNEGANMLT